MLNSRSWILMHISLMCDSQTQANFLRLRYQLISFPEDKVKFSHPTISSHFYEEQENSSLRLRTQVSEDTENTQTIRKAVPQL